MALDLDQTSTPDNALLPALRTRFDYARALLELTRLQADQDWTGDSARINSLHSQQEKLIQQMETWQSEKFDLLKNWTELCSKPQGAHAPRSPGGAELSVEASEECHRVQEETETVFEEIQRLNRANLKNAGDFRNRLEQALKELSAGLSADSAYGGRDGSQHHFDFGNI